MATARSIISGTITPHYPTHNMTYRYAKNIIWSALDGNNEVTASFDIFNELGVVIYRNRSVTGPMNLVQDYIVRDVRDIEVLIQNEANAKAEAESLYTQVTQAKELTIEIV